MPIYEFTEERLSPEEIRITWTKDGEVDALNFWIIHPAEVEQAKGLVRAGAMDGEERFAELADEMAEKLPLTGAANREMVRRHKER